MIILKMFIGFICFVFLCLKLPAMIVWFGHFVVFIKWKLIDLQKELKLKKQGVVVFRPFGLKMFCGRQGAGKTMAMVWYLDNRRRKYPKACIYTNFAYKYQTAPLESLNDLLKYRNGDDGIIFALDEIQNEFSSAVSKDFPETLLSEITMQRKQKITILSSSQVFTRVAKPLREQCYDVMECRTFFGRWTRVKCYDADDYCSVIDNYSPEKKFKLPKRWVRSFIQTDDLRDSYDTYEKVQRLSRQGFAPKVVR
ncbi:MAG TPA: hypothetical protein DDW53_07340 [Lachnoclostridium sp.]|nr:hypothetical protein [Lachnoclostridium sp.]